MSLRFANHGDSGGVTTGSADSAMQGPADPRGQIRYLKYFFSS